MARFVRESKYILFQVAKVKFTGIQFSRKNMDALKKGWFSEVSDMWPGVCLSFEVDNVIHAEKSKYQDIMMLQT